MEQSISIVIPVYNNAPTLRELHARLRRVLAGRHAEIVFVVDACPDDSARVVRELAAADPLITGLVLERNVGQNRAVLAGLAQAQGAIAVVMDADLQDPPEAIPRLLAALSPEDAAVFAGRRGRYESRGRLVTSRIFKLSLHLLCGQRVPIDAGLFVALRRPLIDRLLSCADPEPYVVGLIGRAGLPLRSIPVERHSNDERVSAYTPRTRLLLASRALMAALRARWAPPRTGARACDTVAVAERIGARWGAQTVHREARRA